MKQIAGAAIHGDIRHPEKTLLERIPGIRVSSPTAVGVVLIGALFLLRLPSLLLPFEFNPDESQMLAQGMKFLVDPVPWRAVDTTTSGPINSWLISLTPAHRLQTWLLSGAPAGDRSGCASRFSPRIPNAAAPDFENRSGAGGFADGPFLRLCQRGQFFTLFQRTIAGFDSWPWVFSASSNICRLALTTMAQQGNHPLRLFWCS